MKKMIGILISVTLLVVMFAGCGNGTPAASDAGQPSAPEAPKGDFVLSKSISVISREDGSGTRGAFVELMGIEEKDADGNKVDMTTLDAIITNSTSVMMTSVAGNPYSIGYISLGSLGDTVKALTIDGAQATVENIKSGSYKVARPFNIATTADMNNEAAHDFIAFILSSEGQKVVEASGYISAVDGAAFAGEDVSGKVVVAGSSSITPVMEKLKEAYEVINTNVDIEIQQSDSSTGMKSALEGICDIGMASRELKDSEISDGLTPTVIAIDGIAIIVNNENSIDSVTADDIKGIFKGEILTWSEING